MEALQPSSIDTVTLQLALAIGQAALALALAAILNAFYRAYSRPYLHYWTLSWLALAAYIGAAVVARWSGSVGASWPVKAPLLALAFAASYLQVAWLLLGVHGLAVGAGPPLRLVRGAVAVALAAGVASAWATLAHVLATPSPVAVRCLLAGLAYVFAAALSLRRQAAPSIGRTLTRLALVLYAGDQFVYSFVTFLPMPEQQVWIVLLTVFDVLATALIGVALVAWLLEGERERQRRSGDLAARRRRAQECVYRISEATRTVRDLPALFRSIHESLRGVVPSQNFYIALFDRGANLLSFPYYVDERDPAPDPVPLGRGLTEYVLRTGQPLLATPEVFRSLREADEVELIASDSVDWLGAPLFRQGEVIGVAAIQTYDSTIRISPEDRELFVIVSEQIASAIEARRAADALRHSEARLRVLVEQMPAVLWTTDTGLRFTTGVGSGLAALGLSTNQLAGMPISEYLGAAGTMAIEKHRQALAGESTGFEYEHDAHAYLVHVEPLRDAAGAITGTVGIALDITRERETDRALRESEAKLRQVIDLVPHFIFAKDEEGRFLMANRAVAQAYGTTADRLIGRTDADFNSSQEEVSHFRQDDLEVMRSGQPKRIAEERITDAGGHVRWLQTLKIPFSFSGTGRPAVLGVSTDITERREAEEVLRRAAKDESLTVLAGGVAHDFNNLLAAILGHASLAMKSLPPGSSARRHIEKAASAVERAADLTRQMLAYSGRGHFVVRPTDFNALVRENLPLLEVALPKAVRLVSELEPALPPVDADVGQIQQVLMNLVINAAEAIGPGGGTVTVATGLRRVGPGDSALWRASGQPLRPGEHVCLEVRDDGPGIEAATLERIFEPFFTTKFTGRGLGLAAVLGVVRGHRGALSVDSAPGRGTVFRLLFAPSEEAGEGRHPHQPPGGASDHRLTLLLVDDEEIVREMVGEVLAAEGHEVLCAEDGEKAVALFRERWQDIAAVLLDLSMPGLSGEETNARLHSIDPGVRVILSSGYDRDEATRRFGADQPYGFIQKPYRPQQLLAEIERCLSRDAADESPPGR